MEKRELTDDYIKRMQYKGSKAYFKTPKFYSFIKGNNAETILSVACYRNNKARVVMWGHIEKIETTAEYDILWLNCGYKYLRPLICKHKDIRKQVSLCRKGVWVNAIADRIYTADPIKLRTGQRSGLSLFYGLALSVFYIPNVSDITYADNLEPLHDEDIESDISDFLEEMKKIKEVKKNGK